jgi:hypothetical protein
MNNPFAPVASPGAVCGTGVQAIQQAFAAQAAPAAPVNPFAAVQAPAPAVQYPPLNPPGEAGLGLQPGVPPAPAMRPDDIVEPLPVIAAPTFVAPPVVEPDAPAPRARRGRKPRGASLPPTHSEEKQAMLDAHDAGDLPVESDTVTTSDPRNPTRGYSLDEQLAFATTEELVAQLKTRGYAVTLTDGAP